MQIMIFLNKSLKNITITAVKFTPVPLESHKRGRGCFYFRMSYPAGVSVRYPRKFIDLSAVLADPPKPRRCKRQFYARTPSGRAITQNIRKLGESRYESGFLYRKIVSHATTGKKEKER